MAGTCRMLHLALRNVKPKPALHDEDPSTSLKSIARLRTFHVANLKTMSENEESKENCRLYPYKICIDER